MKQTNDFTETRQSGTEMDQPITALYERLSRDDNLDGDSCSIANQKTYLEGYAADHGYTNIRHYTDDGYSGKDFNRPGWQQLIADVEAGKVGVVIAKDLSRVGRGYVETGFYTQIYFKNMGVHFIAIGSGFDSNDPSTAEFAPFMNVINDMYLKDQSRKMRAAYQLKGKNGLPTNNLCVYGYRKDPDDRNHWLVDDEAADVVRRIFQLAIACHGPAEIARILQNEQVQCPAYYNVIHDSCMARSNTDMSRPYNWNYVTVTNILQRPEYTGCTVNYRSFKKDLKALRMKNPADQWQIIPGTHEAIITPEQWGMAQFTLTVRRRTDSTGAANPLTGKLYCAECGMLLNNHRWKAKATGRLSDDYFDCPTYSRDGGCCCHYISTATVRELLLENIRSVSRYAIQDEAAFAEKVREATTIRQAEQAKKLQQEMKKAQKRIDELDTILQKLFESYALGKIPESRFHTLSAGYEAEQKELREILSRSEKEIAAYTSDEQNIAAFMALAKHYREPEDLTPEMINAFVNRIIVHKPQKVNGQRTMQIDIVYRFIGGFTVPNIEVLPTAEQRKAEERKFKERERNHANYLRRKEKQLASTRSA